MRFVSLYNAPGITTLAIDFAICIYMERPCKLLCTPALNDRKTAIQSSWVGILLCLVRLSTPAAILYLYDRVDNGLLGEISKYFALSQDYITRKQLR
jgi:hypothetical protein